MLNLYTVSWVLKIILNRKKLVVITWIVIFKTVIFVIDYDCTLRYFKLHFHVI